MKVILLASSFPPEAGGGVVRVAKLTRYLPEGGVDPIVITRRSLAGMPKDTALLDAIPQHVQVHRTWHADVKSLARLVKCLRSAVRGLYRWSGATVTWSGAPNQAPTTEKSAVSYGDLVRWFFFIDEAVGWIPFATLVGFRSLMMHSSIGAIYSTSPDSSAHVVALMLHKLFQKRWVMEMRDLWTANPFFTYPTALHRRLNRWLEESAVRCADRVVVISEGMRERLLELYPWASNKVVVVLNGYDSADFAEEYKLDLAPTDKITITYTGAFYAGRMPDVFFEALAVLRDKDPILANRFHIRLAGPPHPRVAEMVRLHGLHECVELSGFVSHGESIRLMLASDVLLLVPGPGKDTVTGKVFEYLRARKPILALVERPSGAADLLERTDPPGSHMIVNNDVDSVVRALCELVVTPLRELHLHEGIVQYDRRHQASIIARWIRGES